MNKTRIDKLVERAFKVVDDVPVATDKTLEQMEKYLDVILPEEYKYICKNYSYEHLDDFYDIFRVEGSSVIGETLDLRKEKNLPHRFLYLASDGTSSYFMETKSDPKESSPVYWIHWEEEGRFCKEEPLQSDYDYFPSFTDFFERLVEDGEKFQREEAEADRLAALNPDKSPLKPCPPKRKIEFNRVEKRLVDRALHGVSPKISHAYLYYQDRVYLTCEENVVDDIKKACLEYFRTNGLDKEGILTETGETVEKFIKKFSFTAN